MTTALGHGRDHCLHLWATTKPTLAAGTRLRSVEEVRCPCCGFEASRVVALGARDHVAVVATDRRASSWRRARCPPRYPDVTRCAAGHVTGAPTGGLDRRTSIDRLLLAPCAGHRGRVGRRGSRPAAIAAKAVRTSGASVPIVRTPCPRPWPETRGLSRVARVPHHDRADRHRHVHHVAAAGQAAPAPAERLCGARSGDRITTLGLRAGDATRRRSRPARLDRHRSSRSPRRRPGYHRRTRSGVRPAAEWGLDFVEVQRGPNLVVSTRDEMALSTTITPSPGWWCGCRGIDVVKRVRTLTAKVHPTCPDRLQA